MKLIWVYHFVAFNLYQGRTFILLLISSFVIQMFVIQKVLFYCIFRLHYKILMLNPGSIDSSNVNQQRCLQLGIVAALLTSTIFCSGQHITISGNVKDSRTKEGIPFVNLSIKNSTKGTVSNVNGGFTLIVPNELMTDTLLVSFVGYQSRYVPIKDIVEEIEILLQSHNIQMKEVLVRPKPPTYYINEAVNMMETNFPSSPFATQAYYREIVKENGKFLALNEGIFKTYYHSFFDTVPDENQLLLYRELDDVSRVAFMRKAQDKIEKRIQKELEEGEEFSIAEDFEISNIFGGISGIIEMGLSNDLEYFLDSNYFKKIEFSFAPKSFYNGNELMVINYSFKRYIDNMKMWGKLYIDIKTKAIVYYDYDGIAKVPAIVKPILFLAGLEINDVNFSGVVRYQQTGEMWYPENYQLYVDILLEKAHWFRANEFARFQAQQIYKVNSIEINHPTAILKDKQFDPWKDMKEQIHNDDGLKWKDMNVVR